MTSSRTIRPRPGATRRPAALALASLLALAGCPCARGDGGSGAAKADVERAVAGLIEADNRSDLAAVMDAYARDALLLAPDGSTFQGSDAIRAHYVEVFAQLAMKLRATPAETVVAGGWAWQRGEVAGTLVMKDGTTQAAHDRYLMVLVDEGGRWRVKRLMWQPLEKK